MLLVSGCLFQLRHLWTGALMNTTKKRPERRLNTGLLAERVGLPKGNKNYNKIKYLTKLTLSALYHHFVPQLYDSYRIVFIECSGV
jgi:hypothetical protein